MIIATVDFVAAVNRRLLESGLLKGDGIRVVTATLVSSEDTWPVRIEVHFRDPSGAAFVWDAGPYTYIGIPGFEQGVTSDDLDYLVNDWSVVAVANLGEWVAVRDREQWDEIRPDEG